MITVKDEKSVEEKEWLSCRDVLWYLVFCGFAISYMLRLNLSLAIVAMVIPRPQTGAASQCTHDLQQTLNISSQSTIAPLITRTSSSSLDPNTRLENTSPASYVQYVDRFAWNEYEQGLALGGYFWLHWATQLPGGLLARRYGTKLVFGLANLFTALLGFLIPFCARYHLYAFVLLRFLQGLIAGVVWPSMHNMTAKWIPPNDRSQFISSYSGSSVGAAMMYWLCAMLINWYGWDVVFYVTSALGVIWYIAWYYLAYDTPQEHPRISETEKTYILINLGDSLNHINSQSVPWKAILTSRPLWITAIASCGGNWGLLTLMSETPSYFSYVQGWNMSATGVLSAAPHLIRMLYSYVFSSFADWLLRTKRMSTTNLRKFAMCACNGIQSIMLLGLAFSGCHPILATVFMITGTVASGALSAGTLASCVDLSPNYASIILGIVNTVTLPAGFISPVIVGFLTNNNQTIEQWRLVFLITVLIIFTTGALYMFVGSSELQPWNDAGNENKWNELEKLRSFDADEVEYVDKTEPTARKENSYTHYVESAGGCIAKVITSDHRSN